MTNEKLEEKYIAEINQGLYGPKFCAHCNQVQPVHTYQLNKSFHVKTEGTTLTASFTGAHMCSVCFSVIHEALDL